MKGIIDKELKIRIVNIKVSYDVGTDILRNAILPTTTNRKNGYLVFDDTTNRNIGIVFMSDDKRCKRYGNSEILFFKRYQKEFGTWRTILRNEQYFMFDLLENIFLTRSEFVCTIDSRIR